MANSQTATDDAVRAHFVQQANACDDLGSPFTARLCRLLAELLDEGTQTGALVLNWPGDARNDALALRLCGGFHALVLSGEDTVLASAYPPHDADDALLRDAVLGALARNDRRLEGALARPPQTNEIARSGMLLPGFLLIARETGLPLALHEIGSSAGLNLLFDRYRYRYGDTEWGNPDSTVRLAHEVRGKAIPLDVPARIVSRQGSDIAPVDVTDMGERLRLRSYIWPDQRVRLNRLDAALAIAAGQPYRLEKADAAVFVEEKLAARASGSAFVLFHTIMWQYMSRSSKDSVLAALELAGQAATADEPIARLRMEPADPADSWAVLSLTLWPGGETRRLANCDYHGRWIDWIA